MADDTERPPPGSATPGLFLFGIGAFVLGIVAGVVAAMAIAGEFQLSVWEIVAAGVLCVCSLVLGVGGIVAWIKLRPREGVPRVEWRPPDTRLERFRTSRSFAVFGLVVWLVLLVHAILSVSLQPSIGAIIYLTVTVVFVVIFSRDTIKRRSTMPGGAEQEGQE